MNAHNLPHPSAARPLPRRASEAWIDALAATAPIERQPAVLLSHVIGNIARSHGSTPALLSDRETLNFAELADRSEGYARWALSRGIGRGQCIALMMSNRPEYVAIWLGLTAAGVVVALINTNLRGRALRHCLMTASPSHVISEACLAEAVTDALGPLEVAEKPQVLIHGTDDGIDIARLDMIGHIIRPRVTIDDTALLIFTSGTTGLPKAARVSHRRVLNWALWFKGLLGNTDADRMYNCLPLYHSVGGVVAVAATLVAGGSTVIAEKFSARRFWSDIRRWDCTQLQYIGELCRYLLADPATPNDTGHRIRVACGNGLRADVWEAFQSRFDIPQIVEFYAATEGNFSLFNAEGKPGAIGRIPPFLRHRFPTAIVRYDSAANAPVRGDDGFCIPAAAGEAGEAIGRIGDGTDASGRFEGYTAAAETERKVLRDVFRKGDLWFRTGDLMRTDMAGYYYFVDRIGDTFRWKGENVSTLEVANALTAIPGVADAVVYGVDVPGADGRAGMALMQVNDGFDLAAFRRQARILLPSYAVPQFLRIGPSVAVTETFKHKKQELIRDGFDPTSTTDLLYVEDAAAGHYRLIDGAVFTMIAAGTYRL